MAAVDPGDTTGVAVCLDNGVWKWHQLKTRDDPDSLVEWLDYWSPEVVVVEDFVGAGPRTRESVRVQRLIGRVQGAFQKAGVPVVVQHPQKRYAFLEKARAIVGDDRKNRHAADAVAHLLRWQHEGSKKRS